MKQRGLIELFGRFRDQGDAAALGEAFDRSAAELHGIARHLVRNREDAADLVQATYLTAIEKVRTLEAGRDPLPWLVGILTLHARNLRRQRGRAFDAAELERAGPLPPDEELERAELAERVRDALADLPERYASVLAPYLAGERRSLAIARVTGRAPGTVRMQIHRGLARLRRALAGAAPFGLWGDARELARLRTRVLERALRARGLPAPVLGSGATAAKLAALLAAAVALLAVGWGLLGSTDPASIAAVNSSSVAEPPPGTNAASPPRVDASAASTRRTPGATAPSDAGAGTLVARRSAGIHGRLLTSASAALAGLEIRLVAISAELLASEEVEQLPAATELERSRCTTDAEGRFVLAGGRCGELLVLAIDCGGPRGCVRLVDGVPGIDGELDVGELRLAPTVELRGRVVDESGAGLAGARVRGGAWPRDFETVLGAHGLALQRDGAWVVNELPEWIVAWLEIFPVPTVRSASDGSFVLAVSGTAATLSVDAPGRAQLLRRDIASVGSSVELGELVLSSGRLVRGRVVDHEGVAVRGGQVLVGATAAPEPAALLACAPTDDQGRFECAGLQSQGQLIVAARRRGALAWKVSEVGSGVDVEVQLEAQARLEVALVDEAGQPIDGVDVELVATSLPGARPNSFARLEPLAQRVDARALFDALAPGSYSLLARQDGIVAARTTVEVRAPVTETTLVLARLLQRTVVVRDAVGAAGVAGARVALVRASTGERVTRAESALDGAAALWVRGGLVDSEVRLEVSHPDYATRAGIALAPAGEPQEVALDRGGVLVAHVLEHGVPVPSRYTLTLQGGARRPFPLQCSTDAAGEARMERIAPGVWGYELSSAWNAHDPLPWWQDSDARPTPLRRGTLNIGAGQITQLELELDGSFEPAGGGRARLRGRFQIPGVDAKRLAVTLSRLSEPLHLYVDIDAQGRFDFGWIPAGRYFARLEYRRGEPAELASAPWRQVLELGEGETREIELELQRARVMLTVRDAAGAPVEDAEFSIVDAAGREFAFHGQPTDEEGIGRALLHATGAFTAVAEHPTRGYARAPFSIAPEAASTDVELVLDPGVPCAGTAHAPVGTLTNDSAGGRWIDLSFRRADAPNSPWRRARVRADADARANFSIAGLAPGLYRVLLPSSNAAKAEPIEFQLGSAGAADLALEFELAQP